MRKAPSPALACYLLAIFSTQAVAADFILYSQNLLRFGHGSKTATKCTALASRLASVDIGVLQEVMVNTTVSTCVLPGSAAWQTLGPYGNGSYKEYYQVLYRTTPRTGGPTVAYANYYAEASPASAYMRRPVAWLFDVTPAGASTAKKVLIGNYHAIWGKSVGGRRTEVGNVASFYTALKTIVFGTTSPPTGGYPVIIGGDWNMGATDSGFGNLSTAGAGIAPNVLTSLNRTGGLSQPYDHFVYTPNIALSNTASTPTTGLPTFRSTVSDHLGIVTEVTLP